MGSPVEVGGSPRRAFLFLARDVQAAPRHLALSLGWRPMIATYIKSSIYFELNLYLIELTRFSVGYYPR